MTHTPTLWKSSASVKKIHFKWDLLSIQWAKTCKSSILSQVCPILRFILIYSHFNVSQINQMNYQIRYSLATQNWNKMPPGTSMDIKRPPWTFMDLLGPPWTSMDLHGPPWTSMDLLRTLRTTMELSGPPWIFKDFYGPPWTSMNLHGPLRTSMDHHGPKKFV